jgi:hypothetical protein
MHPSMVTAAESPRGSRDCATLSAPIAHSCRRGDAKPGIARAMIITPSLQILAGSSVRSMMLGPGADDSME